MDHSLDLLTQLVNTPSITGEEAAVSVLLENYCRARGDDVIRQYVSDSRWNLWVNWQDNPHAAFCTHLDTVPPHFPARSENGYLFGRGACDTKGIIVAMLGAGDHLIAEGKRCSYLFVVGEETDSVGAKHAAASGRSAGYIIVGEPTDNTFVSAHKGVFSYELTVEGISAHSAYPEFGHSALHELLDVIQDLRTASWGHDFVLGDSTINVGVLQGGIAPNVLAPRATARIVHRLVDSLERRKKQVMDIVAGRAEVNIGAQNEPQHMYVPTGYQSKGVSFGTDVPYLRTIGTPILLGPGSIHDAHTNSEKIRLSDIDTAIMLYTELYHILETDGDL
ncbi:MAG: M20/M25/M40 family metallo-hydrolase [Ignavibacteriae bacterium]|nr:M20/M25/M40 family metallo-hydrolase [Ignavibacteriota bacterium]